jgi:hypothetical protein
LLAVAGFPSGATVVAASAIAAAAAGPAATQITSPTAVHEIAQPAVELPAPRRTLKATPATIEAVLADARGGDEIRLAPGRYGWVNIPGEAVNETDRIVLRSADPKNPAIFEGSTIMRPYVTLYQIHDEKRRIDVMGGHHVNILACEVGDIDSFTTGSIDTAAIFLRQMNGQGGNRIVGCYLHDDDFQQVGDVPLNFPDQAYYGIKFELNAPIGTDNIIHGCLIRGFGDGISQAETIVAPGQITITGNVNFDCSDDAIEADGALTTSTIAGNIIGRCLNGISLAPCEPGPVTIRDNVIANYRETGVKTNTTVDGRTWGITVEHNIFQPAADAKDCVQHFQSAQHTTMALYRNIFAWPNAPFDSSQGAVFWDQVGPNDGNEGVPYTRLTLDGNQYWTPRPPSETYGRFRVWSDRERRLVWSSTLERIQGACDQEAHGVFADPELKAQPIRWRHPLTGAWLDLPVDQVAWLRPANDRRPAKR